MLSKNEETGEQAYKEVVVLHRNEKNTTYKLSVGNQIIETTDNHPFWVDGKGWVLAVDLKVGDELVQSNGNHLKIDNIEIVHHDEKVKVYNFTVADFHTYFVSDLGIWVHNIGDCGLRPEAKYLKSGKHGVGWKEGPAMAKKSGLPQGQWSKADLEFAGEKAATLKPGEGGWFDLPSGSTSKVHMPDGSTVDATRIWVRNNGSGTFHGYPAPPAP